MKKTILPLIAAFTASVALSSTPTLDPSARGVWANAGSELVQTDSVLIYFTRNDSLSTKSATLIIPSRGICRTTTFTPDTILFSDGSPVDIRRDHNALIVNGQPMRLIEEINVVRPYPLLEADGSNTAECLQQWQLGTSVNIGEGFFQVMVGTNNNSFMYMVSPYMSYIRAASLRQTPRGSVFLQNIRMMKNMNTGEYTHYSAPDNYALLKHLPEIDPSKFAPSTCTFAPEGIYWSVIATEPKRIRLNGCGEEYTFGPFGETGGLMEWFEFVPQPSWLPTAL